MSQNIFMTGVQKKEYNTYSTGKCGPCTTHQCNGADWEIGSRSCACGYRPDCSNLNNAVCLNPDENQNGNTQLGPLLASANWAESSNDKHGKPGVVCEYNPVKFTTDDQVNAFETLWKTNPNFKDSYFGLMNKYCSEIGTTCINDPVTGNPMPKCSKMFGKTNNNACTKWFSNLAPADRDTFVNNICRANQDLVECKCANRATDKTYQAVSTSEPISDACWWKPCKNDSYYLLPSNMLNPTCPSDICQTVINIDRTGRDVDINDIINYITCGASPAPKPPSPPIPNPFSHLPKFVKYILIGALVIIILLIILLGLSSIVKHSGTKSISKPASVSKFR